MSSDEERPFLDDASIEEKARRGRASSPQGGKGCFLTVSLVANLVLTLTCALLSIALLRLASPGHGEGESKDHISTKHELSDPYSPANAAIEYEYRELVSNDTRFTGHPGSEWEKNMHKLMEGTLLRISDEELRLYGSDSIPLKGGGYAGGLGVAHNLHCVKKLKKFLYRDHFYPDMDPKSEDFAYTQSHADHCLDYLRQSIMCRVDYSMYTVYWGERQPDIPTHHVPGLQKCVNWDKLHKWMLDRSASTNMLVRPEH